MSTTAIAPDLEQTLEAASAVILDEIAAADRAIAEATARRIRALAAAQSLVLANSNLRVSAEPEMQLRSMADQIALQAHVHGRTIVQHMDEAWSFVEHFPATVEAIATGSLSLAHARVIRTEGLGLNEPERQAFEHIALDRATHESPARLREILRAVSEEFKTTSFDERHSEARKERRVYVVDHDDGMSDLIAYLPTHIVHGIVDGLTTLAGSVKMANRQAKRRLSERRAEQELEGVAPENLADDDVDPATGELCPEFIAATDDRNLDQIRADALCDLLLSCTPAVHGSPEDAIHAVVQITIPALALLDRSDSPANLTGSGPIDIETAKRLAGASSTWERLITDPVGGQILAVDTYRPTASQRRLLQARDERCRFQGCRGKPWQGDLDHSHDHAFGGETSNDNLAHLCRYHHTMKHAMHWRIRHLAHGKIEWTDPGGRTYVDVPPHVARFIPTDELPPSAPKPRSHHDIETWTGIAAEHQMSATDRVAQRETALRSGPTFDGPRQQESRCEDSWFEDTLDNDAEDVPF